MRILVTGGAGFIGSNFVQYILNNHPSYRIVNVDNLTYAGNLNNLLDVEGHCNYEFVHADISNSNHMDDVFQSGFDVVVNFAAESHVDRSILDSSVFVRSNVIGTQVLLELSRKYNIKRYIQISTDEVYGTLGDVGLFSENSPLAPNSPYSASKAGADLLVRAYYETYGLDINITRCSNNYGPYQFPEKLIPLIISNALDSKPLPVYGDGMNIRDWLHVSDHCAAIDLVIHEGRSGEVYNIGGNNEHTNIQIVRTILEKLGKPETLIKYVNDRPGHDRRYGIDATKIQSQLKWEPKLKFEDGITETIKWYIDNQSWVKTIRSGAYREYYEQQYGARLRKKV